ncbi:MAG: sodium:solute symporter [Saprospiraceae bacterium]|nr:MAG: sodium:solute symporter [Saprospiraceae bacterium]
MTGQLTPALILTTIALYFATLIGISWLTSRRANNADFFIAGRKSPWWLIAIGMVGASISGVTFISIPGAVGGAGANQAFSYMQMVFGYLLGYFVIATVLMPVYYRLNLTSIYSYLDQRFGHSSNKTGAAYFLLSRVIGSAFRLYLVAIVLDRFVLGVPPLNVPFWVTVFITIVLIWVYTFKGGLKTIIWTDALQALLFLAAVTMTIVSIGGELGKDLGGLIGMVQQSEYSKIFFFEGGWGDPNNFFKQFFAGALIAIVMTGLDQDMMQKNISCPNIRDAQKNMFTFCIVLVFTNLLFLTLGALLYLYAGQTGMELPARSDYLYPMIALEHLSPALGIIFMVGLIAAAYSSADSALTALTTSFCVDFLNFEKSDNPEAGQQRTRRWVHVGFSFVLMGTILIFKVLNNDAVINEVFKAAGYTYGPLLGLFTFGMLTKIQIKDSLVIPVCLAAPVLTWLIVDASLKYAGFDFGFLNLALNGLLTMAGLWLISKKSPRIS